MTTELTPCPNCGEPSNNGRTCRLCESEDAMNKALTQRPAAQTEREAFEGWARPNGYDLRRNDVLGHYSSIDTSRAWSGFRAGRASLPAPQQATPEPVGWTDADADAARLAMELECLLLDIKDTAAVSRWWKSANEALDLHRARLAAAQAKQ